MTAVASLFITLTLSLLVTRIAAMALMLTGMSRESAKFQARSAFTGVGYTTTEAEDVVAHPVRRRIVMMLMLLGNAGIATVVATSMLTFMETTRSADWWQYILVVATGLAVLWFLASNRMVERYLNRVIAHVLTNWAHLQVRDYVAILQLQSGYAVTELLVEANDWLANQQLMKLRLPQEGVLVLGIRREEGAWMGTPTGETSVYAGDTLVLYGPIHRIEELDQRRKGRRGETAHQEAVMEHEEELEEQVEQDEKLEEVRKREEMASADPSAS